MGLLKDHLIAHYKMNENTDDKVVSDSSGNDHDGLAQQDTSAIHVAGKINGAFDFDKVAEDYIEIADHDDFSPVGTPFSISAWVNMRDATSFSLASKGVFPTDGEWQFSTDIADKIIFWVFDNTKMKYIGRSSSISLTAYQNQWIHVVATYDGGVLSSGIKIYINGILIDCINNEDASGFENVRNLNHAIWIGKCSPCADGLIDNVMFFDKVLSAAEVKYLHHGGKGREGDFANITNAFTREENCMYSLNNSIYGE